MTLGKISDRDMRHCHFLKSTCDIGDPPSRAPCGGGVFPPQAYSILDHTLNVVFFRAFGQYICRQCPGYTGTLPTGRVGVGAGGAQPKVKGDGLFQGECQVIQNPNIEISIDIKILHTPPPPTSPPTQGCFI